MPETGPTVSAAKPNLFASVRSLWGVLLATLYTRIDLITTELEEEAIRVVQLIVIGVAGLVCLSTAVFFLMFLLVALFWDNRLLVLSLVCGGYLLVGIILLGVAWQIVLKRPKFLAHTLTELRRDVEGLHPSGKIPGVEP